MAVRKILVWPNPELSKVALPVEDKDYIDGSLKELIKDLFATMAVGNGIGLAATQIGVHKRVFVLDVENAPGGDSRDVQGYYGVMVNPEILEVGSGVEERDEGCLSVPGQFYRVARPLQVRVKFYTGGGTPGEGVFTGLLARCILHEIDHLNGVVFVKYLGSMARDIIRRKMKKIGRNYLPEARHEASQERALPLRARG